MQIVLLIIGIIITTWAIVESLWTALWVDGNSAPITGKFTTIFWRGFRSIVNEKNHRSLSLSGPLILFLTVILWISFILIGWSLIIYSSPSAINAKDNMPISLGDALWYVAYTMFTVGNGDFTPKDGFWQFISSLIAMTGMLLVTMSVTYILQVISAVVDKRTFANQVMSIGRTSEEFVKEQWNGNGFGAIELQMVALSGQLSKLNEQHLAYPILNYYHAARLENSVAAAVAIYDDALTIIANGIPNKYHPPTTILTSGRRTVNSYLQTLKAAYINPSKESPPLPDLNILRDENIPIISDDEFQREIKNLENRRKLLYGAVINDAWHWPKYI